VDPGAMFVAWFDHGFDLPGDLLKAVEVWFGGLLECSTLILELELSLCNERNTAELKFDLQTRLVDPLLLVSCSRFVRFVRFVVKLARNDSLIDDLDRGLSSPSALYQFNGRS
jgi:hypothetical protein